MKPTKTTKEKVKPEVSQDNVIGVRFEPIKKISPIEFADFPTIKDKINEIITYLNA